MDQQVPVAIIGGSGLYNIEGLKIVSEVNVDTPWGSPSDAIVIAEVPLPESKTLASGSKTGLVAFLARHGRGHTLTPSEVPNLANIAALKRLGCREILAFSAVGSLKEEVAPRDFVLPDQIIDRTKGVRRSTFFGDGVVGHVPFGDPFNRSLAEEIYAHASKAMVEFVDAGHRGSSRPPKCHLGGTLVCMEGPAFSTRAESELYRSWGASVINMSALPEAKLAREAEISYQMICMATDYDCWHQTEEDVTVEAVLAHLRANANNAQLLLKSLLPEVLAAADRKNPFEGMSRGAVITNPLKRNKETVKKLDFILPGYF